MADVFDLVFRGGGIKGLAFIGALESLTEAKHVTRRLVGTSAGAIFATAFAAGYTPKEMEQKIATRTDDKFAFETFLQTAHRPAGIPEILWKPTRDAADNTIRRLIKIIPGLGESKTEGWGGKTLGLVLGGALCDDTAFRLWMREILTGKKIDPEITMDGFHRLINRDRPRQLTLIATDLTDQAVLVLNERTSPKLPLLEAVRMSTGIPFLWKELVWNAQWGTCHGKEIAGHRIVDGGLLSNFPMRYLLDAKHNAKDGIMGPLPGERVIPLGFMLDATKSMPDMPELTESSYLINQLPAVRLASQLLDTLTDAWDREAIREHATAEQEKRIVCRIGTRGVGHLDFDLKEDRLAALLNSGRCAMRAHLEYLSKKP